MADPKTKNEEITVLKEAVDTMAGLSREGFSKIAAIAKLAVLALETPRGCGSVEAIAQAFLAIEQIAVDIGSCMEFEAEEVGYDYLSQEDVMRMARRYEAKRAAMELRAEGANHG